MIRQKFLEAVKTLNQAIFYAPEDVLELTKLLNKVGTDHDQKK